MHNRLSVRENGGDANCRLTVNIARALDHAKAMVKPFAVKMRLRDFLKIVEIPTLVVSNICKMALASNIGCRVIDGL